jgi:hypothetical protein
MTETEDRGSRLRGRTDAVAGLFRTKLGAAVDPDAILRGVRERLRAERSGAAAARFWPARLAWAAAAALVVTAAFLGFGLGRSTARLRASAGRLAALDPLGAEAPEEERK